MFGLGKTETQELTQDQIFHGSAPYIEFINRYGGTGDSADEAWLDGRLSPEDLEYYEECIMVANRLLPKVVARLRRLQQGV